MAGQRGDRRPHDERRPDHAPEGSVLRRGGRVRPVARNVRRRGRVQPARVPIGPAEGPAGVRRDEHPAGRHADRPVRRDAAVAVRRGVATFADEKGPRKIGRRNQRRTSAVSGGPQYFSNS
uniref:(northern house mosquito) hypothetical protein n=1 Tax=Culex pipiens TaxID=7175 RepID=A0A8D8APW8_CULPI